MPHKALLLLPGCLSLCTALSDLPFSLPSSGSVSVDVIVDWGASSTSSSGKLPVANAPTKICSGSSVTISNGPYASTTISGTFAATTSLISNSDHPTVSPVITSTLIATVTSTALNTVESAAINGGGANTSVTSSLSGVSFVKNCTSSSSGWTTAAGGANTTGCMQGWSSGNNSNASTAISGSPSVTYGTSNASYYAPSIPTMATPSWAGLRRSVSPFVFAILLLAGAQMIT